MIKNFETVKNQLNELAEVINLFNSEAVQLRIIELIFNAPKAEDNQSEESIETKARAPQGVMRRRKKTVATKSDASANTPKKSSMTGTGGRAILTDLAKTDFFDTPKTIKDIINHCSVNLARNMKANAFSGKLSQMTRNGELTRKKNSDNQYEYKKA